MTTNGRHSIEKVIQREGHLQIEYIDMAILRPDPQNPRIHSIKQVRQIARSMENFGFNVPVLIDTNLQVIAGHGRLLAAQLLKMAKVPAIRIEHLSEAQRRAFLIADSYGQDLANKHAMDCRTILNSAWYRALFPHTRLSNERQAMQEFVTTKQGSRLSTSVGGVLTGRGADYIIIDDPLKPDEALSETQRKAVNEWFDHTLYSRLNDKRTGRIVLVMQRLHENDLVGHVLGVEPWNVVQFPAIAEATESHTVETPYGLRRFVRQAGEALHDAREPFAVLERIRHAQGEYNLSGQYQQAPAPLGGGLVKIDWFKTSTALELPSKFETVFQSWDTANKPTELSDFSVCTTWGLKDKHAFLLNVLRKRLAYPELKRAVGEQAEAFSPQTILIEDKASGTQLIQDLINEGVHEIKRYVPTMDKIMRMHSVTNTIENGFVHLPEKAPWLGEYLHELATFPKGKYDDQADSTSQALEWFKQQYMTPRDPWICVLQVDDFYPFGRRRSSLER